MSTTEKTSYPLAKTRSFLKSATILSGSFLLASVLLQPGQAAQFTLTDGSTEIALDGSTFSTDNRSNTNGAALYITNNSSLSGTGLILDDAGAALLPATNPGYIVQATTGGKITLTDAAISSTSQYMYALFASGSASSITLNGGTLSVAHTIGQANMPYAANITGGAQLVLNNVAVETNGTGLAATTGGIMTLGAGTTVIDRFYSQSAPSSAVRATGAGSQILVQGATGNVVHITTENHVGAVSVGSGATLTADKFLIDINTSGYVTTLGGFTYGISLETGTANSVISNGTINVKAVYANGISAGGVGNQVNDVVINVTALPGNGYVAGIASSAYSASAGSRHSTTVNRGVITVTDGVGSTGVTSQGSFSDIFLKGTQITVTNGSGGLFTTSSGFIDADGVVVKVTGGTGAQAEGSSKIQIANSSFETTGTGLFSYGATLKATDTQITTSGANGYGLRSDSQTGAGLVEVIGGRLTTAGTGAHGVVASFGGTATLVGTPVTTTGDDAALVYMLGAAAHTNTVSIDGGAAPMSAAKGVGVLIRGATNNLSLTNVDMGTNGTLFDVRHRALTGTSDPDPANPGILNAVVEGSTLRGAARPDDGSTIALQLSGNSVWYISDAVADAITPVSGLSGDQSRVNDLSVTDSRIVFNAPVGGSFKSLEVAGNYTGTNATISLNAQLDGDGSPSDKLVINGGMVSGNTSLLITNSGGAGALTVGDGIVVIDAINGGTTGADSFMLGGRVAAGAYDYKLYRGGSSSDDSWYLRSTETLGLTDPQTDTPPQIIEVPNIRSEVPLMAAVMPVALEYGFSVLGTLHERMGTIGAAPVIPAYEERVVRGRNGKREVLRTPTLKADENRWFAGAWSRVIGDRGFQDHNNFINRGPSYNYTFAGIQAGLDVLAREQADGTLDKVGIYVGYGNIDVNVKGAWSGKAGSVDMDAYTVGGYWTHKAAQGWYSDAVIQGTWYQADAKSISGQRIKPDGFGFLASLEGGYSFNLGNGLTLEPQAQIIYQTLSFDNVTDAYGRFDLGSGDSVRGRLGLRLSKDWAISDGAKPRLLNTWLRTNVWHEFSGKTSTTVASLNGENPLTVSSSLGGTWFEIGAGVSGQISEEVSLFASGAYSHSLDNRGREAWNGRLGATIKW